jgi:hypothetical protein
MKRSQSATEFMLLIAAVLIIFLPMFYLLTEYSTSAGKGMVSAQIRQIGQKLVDESREMHYLGAYSREVVSVNMPNGVVNISTLTMLGSPKEHYLRIRYYSEDLLVDMTIPSEVPLISSSSSLDTSVDCTHYIGNCPMNPSGQECLLCQFKPEWYSEGRKDFKLETLPQGQPLGSLAVNITMS